MKRPENEHLLRTTALRIVKDRPGLYGLPEIRCSADFYCCPLPKGPYFYETEDEFVLYVEHLLLTDACVVTASFAADARWTPTDVLCEGRRLPFERQGDSFVFWFEISGLSGKTRTLYVHTLLREPGLTLRLEQNTPGRRAGVYRSGAYPAVEIEAASHYMFAARRILQELEIPRFLSEEELGYILLLSFETYNEVHGDYPPHWHLILRWPEHCGSQAPHIYLDNRGHMTRNVMYIDMIPNVSCTYAPLEWCPFKDKYGRTVMCLRIEEDGGMSLTREGRPLYTVSPYGSSGVTVLENGAVMGRLQVINDTAGGKLEILWTDDAERTETETVLYDPLTGAVAAHIPAAR